MVSFLVVDDSPSIRLRVGAALRQASPGVVIHEADNAALALQMFREHNPDVVFLDMMLAEGPGGLDVLKGMLSVKPDARIVLMTSLPANHPDMLQAIGLGASGHLPKPLTNEAVKKVLDAIEAEMGRLGRIR